MKTIRIFLCVTLIGGCAMTNYRKKPVNSLSSSGCTIHDPKRLADSPIDLSEYLCALLSKASDKDLSYLTSDSDCTIALSAAWERLRRTVPLKPKLNWSLDRAALIQFIGFVEARTGVDIPPIWGQAVLSANSHSRDNIWFPLHEETGAPSNRRGHDAVSLRREEDRLIIKNGNEEWSLRAEADMDFAENVTVQRDGDYVFIAIYGWPPEEFTVYVLNRNTKKQIWTKEVWAASCVMAYTGQGRHFVEIRSSQNVVVVFGVSGSAAYLEILDKSTGTNLCRFNSSYLQSFATPEPNN